MTNFGERLRSARKGAGMTQRQLGEQMGWEGSRVARVETGWVQDPRGSTIVRLAQVLGVTSDYLLGLDEARR